ncbi:MAG: YceI family protein [Candidatus Sulfotelmatobacter sp.]
MTNIFRWKSGIIIILLATALAASAQRYALQADPAKSTVKFTLDAALHTVNGTFQVKPGALQFDPGSNQIQGEILVDAKSGKTGNGMRDRKMHKDVLESESYPEISFRPQRIEGSVRSGQSSVSVHGIFRLHGVDREITVPAQVEMSSDHWTASIHFTIPYQKWGLKNPSTLFLRVSDSVQIEVEAAGSVVQQSASNTPAQ